MAQSKRETYERKREYIQELADDGEILQPDATAILQWCDAYDDEKATATPNNDTEYVGDDRWGTSRAPTTMKTWLVATSIYAREVDGSLLDATAAEINRASQAMKDGHAGGISQRAKNNGGLSKNTIASYQNPIIKFIQHNSGAVADPDAIHVFDKDSTLVDPGDMLTEAEFHALRNAPEHPRDRAIVNLFLYTGQRNHAIRTLRVKDIDLDEGIYRLNTDVDGLKGADRVATWNPLLGATSSLRDWERHHPAWDDPDAYLLTERRSHVERDPHSTISDDTVNRALRSAAELAAHEEPGIENKPTNAHAMRHNFVTMCKLQYDMDNGTIKRLIRHKPNSTVMETTYAHLSDEDYIDKAEKAFGIKDDEDEEFDPSPEFCNVCDEPLPHGAKACPACGIVYAPDARTAKHQAEEEVGQAKEEAESLEEYQGADAIAQQVKEDPEFAAELMDKLGEYSDE